MELRSEQPPTIDDVKELVDTVDWEQDERRIRHMVQVLKLWIDQDRREATELDAGIAVEASEVEVRSHES